MPELSRRFARLRERSETGFTVLELLIVMALLAVVMSIVGAGMISLTDTTRSTDDRSRADTELRNAVEAIARDVRAANPIDAQSPVSLYNTQISFEVFCTPVGGTCAATNLRKKVYRVTAHRLEVSVGGGPFQQILGPSLDSTLPLAERQFAIINSVTEPVFTYLRDDGSPLPTGGSSPAPAARFRDCTQAVRIHLKIINESGNTRSPSDLTTTVTLRNYNEVSEC